MKAPSHEWHRQHPVSSLIWSTEWMRQQALRRAAWMAALMLLSLCVVVREWNRDPLFVVFAALTALLFGVWAALFVKMRHDFTAMLPDLHQLRRQFGDTPRAPRGCLIE